MTKIKFFSKAGYQPKRMSDGAAAWDFRACIEEEIRLQRGHSAIIGTGVRVNVLKGYALVMNVRSGLGIKYHTRLSNNQGWIDSDYEGEIKISIINDGLTPVTIKPNMRFAQGMVVKSEEDAEYYDYEELVPVSERGEGGFGHTGTE